MLGLGLGLRLGLGLGLGLGLVFGRSSKVLVLGRALARDGVVQGKGEG
jgi:hypothetical protein